MKKCPKCKVKSSECLDIAVHLMESHSSTYEESMQWLKDQEEKTCAYF